MLRLYVEIYALINGSLRRFVAVDANWHAGSRDAAAEQFPHPTRISKPRLRRFGTAFRWNGIWFRQRDDDQERDWSDRRLTFLIPFQ
jgi:hypothetical protein